MVGSALNLGYTQVVPLLVIFQYIQPTSKMKPTSITNDRLNQHQITLQIDIK